MRPSGLESFCWERRGVTVYLPQELPPGQRTLQSPVTRCVVSGSSLLLALPCLSLVNTGSHLSCRSGTVITNSAVQIHWHRFAKAKQWDPAELQEGGHLELPREPRGQPRPPSPASAHSGPHHRAAHTRPTQPSNLLGCPAGLSSRGAIAEILQSR